MASVKGATFEATRGESIATHGSDTAAACDQRLIDALEDFIPHVMRRQGTPGLNIALARRGRVIWEGAFGYADLQTRTPMTIDTVTHSGSMAKAYTSVAAMQLVERGVLALDGAVNSYFKDFQIKNPFGQREITVKDLLTHQSGLNGNAAGSTYRHPPRLAERVRQAYERQSFRSYGGSWRKLWHGEVGKRWEYSNLGMATLGLLVEETNPEGLSFSDFVQRNIIDALGMTSTQFPPVQDAPYVREDIAARYSSGYISLGHAVLPTPPIYFADFPAGAVVTIPRDHIRLLMALMNGGALDSARILKAETVENMLTPHVDAAKSPFYGEIKFGLGLQLMAPGTPDFSFGHSGAHMFGWTNNFRAFPKIDISCAIFTNHWPMLAGYMAETLVIEDFIKTWAKTDLGGPQAQRSMSPERAWKTSYALGRALTEQLMGRLAVGEPLEDAMIDRMTRDAAIHRELPNAGAGWDPDAFRQGIVDMQSVPMTLDGIRAAVSSGRLRLSASELEEIGRELGLEGSPLLISVTN